jgi:hypothetical protein
MGNLAQRFGGDVQQARSLGAKGMGQQPPQVQPQPGMGGKGVGQPPAQQPNLNNALSGLAGAPVQTYPFPQPPAQQPAAGMGGKGVGTRQLDPAMQPYVNNLVSGMQQAEPGVLDPSRYTNYGQPAPTPVAGMGAKGVGQFPPQTQQPGMPNFVQPYMPPQTGMAGKGVGTPAPVQQPRMYTNSYDDFPMINRTQPNSAPVLSPQEQDLAARQAFEAMQAQRQVQQPAPVPVQPLRQPARPAPVAARPNPLRTPVPVRPEPKNVANQRALQQLASRNRSRR